MKDKIREHFLALYNEVSEGKVSPTVAYMEVRSYVAMLNKIETAFKELAVEEMRDCETAKINGCLVEYVRPRRYWKYDHIEEYNAISKRFKQRKQEIQRKSKAAFEFHQNVLNKGKEFVDRETGEIVTPAKVEFGDDNIKVTPLK